MGKDIYRNSQEFVFSGVGRIDVRQLKEWNVDQGERIQRLVNEEPLGDNKEEIDRLAMEMADNNIWLINTAFKLTPWVADLSPNDQDDLFQKAFIGLYKIARRYDPWYEVEEKDRGDKKKARLFSTFAIRSLSMLMITESMDLRGGDILSGKLMSKNLNLFSKAKELFKKWGLQDVKKEDIFLMASLLTDLDQDNNRRSSEIDLAAFAEYKETYREGEAGKKILRRFKKYGLVEQLANMEMSIDSQQVEVLSNTEVDTTELRVLLNRRVELIFEALDLLTEQQREVIEMYYFDEMKLEEIGNIYKITKERVRQIREKALGRLRCSKYREILRDLLELEEDPGDVLS